MRAVLAVKGLGDGLRFVARAIPNRVMSPVVANIKLEVRDASLVLTATDLNQQHTAVVANMACEAGAITVPGQLADLISKLPPDAEVTIKTEGDRCLISCGRGRWRLPTLPAGDFPVLDPPGAEAANFVLQQAEARRFVARLAHAVGDEETRYYLCGVHLHCHGGKPIAVATNGHVLAKISIDLDPGKDLGVIIPTKAVEILAEIANRSDVEIRIDRNKIALSSGPWAVVSKLIDGTFPDYTRVIPEPVKDRAEVASAELTASIERHKAAAKLDTGIGLTWKNGTLITCLARSEDGAIEEIEAANSSGSGRVAAQAGYLLDTIKALASKSVLIEHDSKQYGSPIRFSSAAEPDTVMIVMPMAWAKPIVDDQPQPPARKPPQRTSRGT
jgi:DNA polymerase-3 subunit beta